MEPLKPDSATGETSERLELEKCVSIQVTPMLILDINTVLTYFSTCEFYDPNCNNAEYKMQAATELVPFPSAMIHCMYFCEMRKKNDSSCQFYSPLTI